MDRNRKVRPILPKAALILLCSLAMGGMILPLGLLNMPQFAPLLCLALAAGVLSFVRPFWG